jgi:hypothetical protein
MKKTTIPLTILIIFFSATIAVADTQTLTILGGYGVQGDVDPYTEASLDGGLTWQPAYLTGWHPWGFAEGTNSWINFDPDDEVGLNTTTDYRIRFFIPSDFSDPHMTFVIKADNYAWVWLNNTFITEFAGQSSGAAGDRVIAQALEPGSNEITIRLQDWGGLVGLNYRIDITMESDEAPSLLPPSIYDSDNDGISDEDDQCLDTPSGEVVDSVGCSISQLCSVDDDWRNHGQYVSCVANEAEVFFEAGLITEDEKDAIVSEAAQSDTGKKENPGKKNKKK